MSDPQVLEWGLGISSGFRWEKVVVVEWLGGFAQGGGFWESFLHSLVHFGLKTGTLGGGDRTSKTETPTMCRPLCRGGLTQS